ncbi:ABC transporter substrate-binding protein [Micropruina sp.]|uniref:ABC transporter substrate-binding protein n=1 Tax=Micropruina sp. TaxID=2737536 RepID=UPI0039E3A8CE
MPPFLRSLIALATACVTVVGAAGCIRTPDPLPTGSTATPTADRVFTVLTVQPATTTDPAGVTNDSDSMVVLDLFQRLMLVQPSTQLLKPDLAKECLYTAPTVFECSLPKDAQFSNGHLLTSSDVKFSLLRALRLAPGQMSLLGALRTIETPDPYTVRFRLKYPDNQFGYGLAVPAASVVDEEAYDADKLRPVTQAPIGSGPYALEAWDNRGLTITKFAGYVGALDTDMPKIRINWADSATAEEALVGQQADIVWRTLSPAAIERLSAEIAEAQSTRQEPDFYRWRLFKTVLQRLVWLPSSAQRSNAALRRAVTLALQADRTATSILPSMINGHTDSFAMGGDPKLPKLNHAGALTVRFTDSSPGMEDLARQVVDRLHSGLGITVRLVAEGEPADLELRDSAPQVNTALGWLQDYLKNPLPGSAGKLEELEERFRSSSKDEVQLPALSEIQKQAAADATVVPIAEVDGVLFLSSRVELVGEALGPGWQLALWGARWRS